jgi:membrane protease YdiL (CAAX protease family)
VKKCPYCGKEYSDDATVCIIDTEVLVEHPPKPKIQEEPKPAKEKLPPEPYRHWPDYQWRAKDAWKCVGFIILFTEIILPAAYYFLHLSFPNFYHSGFGFACRRVLLFAIWTITACFFARTETFKSFLQAFGFDRKPTRYVWFGMTMALLLRFVSHFMYTHHWGRGVYNGEITSFENTIGLEKWLFQFSPLVLAPIFEEAVNRGFLYKAFRASYSVAVSMLIMVAWTLWTHFGYWHHSWIATLDYCAWTILQCYLREKSSSLWDCVLTHFVSNAAILFLDKSLW